VTFKEQVERSQIGNVFSRSLEFHLRASKSININSKEGETKRDLNLLGYDFNVGENR
jgi:hypothetical protein